LTAFATAATASAEPPFTLITGVDEKKPPLLFVRSSATKVAPVPMPAPMSAASAIARMPRPRRRRGAALNGGDDGGIHGGEASVGGAHGGDGSVGAAYGSPCG